MKCLKCGTDFPDFAPSCPQCGYPNGQAVPPAPAQSAQPPVSAQPVLQAAPQPAPQAAPKAPVPPAEPDVSLRFVADSFLKLVKGFELDPIRKAAAIVSACASLFFLIAVAYSPMLWFCAIASIFTTWLCVRKVPVDTFAFAIACSVFALNALFSGLRGLTYLGGLYFFYNLDSFIVHLVLYAFLALVWLITVLRRVNRHALRLSAFIVACVIGAYEFISIFLTLRYGALAAVANLGWICLLGVYALLIFSQDMAEMKLRRAAAPQTVQQAVPQQSWTPSAPVQQPVQPPVQQAPYVPQQAPFVPQQPQQPAAPSDSQQLPPQP